MRRRKIKKSPAGTVIPGELPLEKVSEEEKQYRLLYDFADYLEQLDRGAVGGAKILLREFLKKKGLYPK